KQNAEIKYYGSAGNTNLFLSDSVFYYVYARADTDTVLSDSLHTYFKIDTLYRYDMKLIGINSSKTIASADTSQGYKNYFYGDSSYTHALTYQEIKYKDIYSKIDLSFHNDDEFRFNIDTTGNPSSIKFYYQAATASRSVDSSSLKLTTSLGTKIYYPEAYQKVSGVWQKFDVYFHLTDSVVTFNLGSHYNSVPLMIKLSSSTAAPPVINKLRWSQYYHGNSTDRFTDVQIDNNNRIYTVGYSYSSVWPHFLAIQPINVGGGFPDVIVVKFNSNRSRSFATFYGGSNGDFGTSITSDVNGNIIFTGYTFSDNSAISFPQCPSCSGYPHCVCSGFANYGNSYGGAGDGFLVKLTPDGQVKLMSTYYGGTGQEKCYSITMDDLSDYIYIGGQVYGNNVPGTNVFSGYNQANNIINAGNGFLARFDNSTNDLVWASQLGGSSGYDMIESICTDKGGNLYAYGLTQSNATTPLTPPLSSNPTTDFPICNPDWTGIDCPGSQSPYVEGSHGGIDNFITKFDPSNKIIWSTMFGGNLDESNFSYFAIPPHCITVSNNADIYIVGATNSTVFPTLNESGAFYDASYATGSFRDGYIAKFDRCSELQWATYYGYNGEDFATGIAMNVWRYFYVVGYTSSSNMATVNNGGYFYNDTYNINGGNAFDAYDGFVLKFNPSDALVYSTYFGGTKDDQIESCSVQYYNSNFIFVGNTNSSYNQSFPLCDYAANPPPTSWHLWQKGNISSPFITNFHNNCTLCREDNFDSEDNSDIESLIIFPNPSMGTVSLKSKESEIRSIYIIDIMAKTVFKKENISLNLYECDLTMLPSGIYIIETFINQKVFRNKLVISR
ncbi:MAG: T9SS type A sorting domain-containing protein, partial [Bacteroidota bacterium]